MLLHRFSPVVAVRIFLFLSLLFGGSAHAITCAFLEQLSASGDTSSQTYLQIIRHLSVGQNSLSPKFFAALEVSTEPLNPFDYPVQGLTPQLRRNYEGAFKKLLNSPELKNSWSELKPELLAVWRASKKQGDNRQEAAEKTQFLWVAQELAPTQAPRLPPVPTVAGTTVIESFDRRNLWNAVRLDVGGIYITNAESGITTHLDYSYTTYSGGNFASSVPVFTTGDGRLIYQFIAYDKTVLAEGSSGGEGTFIAEIKSEKFWQSVDVRKRNNMLSRAFMRKDGSFDFLNGFYNVEDPIVSHLFYWYETSTGQSHSLNIELTQPQVAHGPHGIFLAGFNKHKIQVYQVNEGVAKLLTKDIQGYFDKFEMTVLPSGRAVLAANNAKEAIVYDLKTGWEWRSDSAYGVMKPLFYETGEGELIAFIKGEDMGSFIVARQGKEDFVFNTGHLEYELLGIVPSPLGGLDLLTVSDNFYVQEIQVTRLDESDFTQKIKFTEGQRLRGPLGLRWNEAGQVLAYFENNSQGQSLRVVQLRGSKESAK